MRIQIPDMSQRLAYRASLYGVGHLTNDEAFHTIRMAFCDDDTLVAVCLDSLSRLRGAVSYRVHLDRVHIHALGSLEAGVGSLLIKLVENLATELGRPVTLLSTRLSEGFYVKQGYDFTSGRLMSKTTVIDEANVVNFGTKGDIGTLSEQLTC